MTAIADFPAISAAGLGLTSPVELLTQEAYRQAVREVQAASLTYYEGTGLRMDDATYDRAVREIAAAENAHPDWISGPAISTAVAAGALNGEIAHAAPMLSLDNVYSPAELSAWCASRQKSFGAPIAAWTVEAKFDGQAIALTYTAGKLLRAVTRGGGEAGKDVTHALPRIPGLPRDLGEDVDVEVRGEVLFLADDYLAADDARVAIGKGPFANTRNGAAGTLNAKTVEYPVTLTFFAYGQVGLVAGSHTEAMARLAGWGLTGATGPAAMTRCATVEQVNAAVVALQTSRNSFAFEIDGAVIKVDDTATQAALGLSSKAPRWGIAYKYPALEAMSTLEEVVWQVGRTGAITPRGRIKPVFVAGTTITHMTLHNAADIARKGFLLHDSVLVKRAGDVIPRLEAPLVLLRTGAELPIVSPTVCPRCAGPLDRSQARWRCEQGRACGLPESLRYAASRDALYIKGLGDKIIRQLVEAGLVTDIADLFILTREQLLTLPRMGELTADALLLELAKAKSQPFARIVTCLGIKMTGRSMSKRLAASLQTMDALQNASISRLCEIKGIDERAVVIVEELAELAPVIAKLIAAGVNMGPDAAAPVTPSADPVTTAGALPLAGMTVVVSGAMSGALAGLNRNEMRELIERAGGTSSDSVSVKTSLLVCFVPTDPAVAKSSKAVKAAKLNVPIDSPEVFADRVAALLP